MRKRTAREASEAMEASTANEAMMEAARSGSRQACRRAAERWAGDWLGCPQSYSENPDENPVLLALMDPLGVDAARGFDDFFGDVRHWHFGPWSCAHWAAAGGNEEALSWAMEGGGAAEELFRRESRESGPCRSALGLIAQRGDPAWLERALEMAQEHGASLARIVKGDLCGEPTALGLAVFEWAQALADGDGAAAAGFEACARSLAAKGFAPDSAKAPAAKLACALAFKRTPQEARAMAPAVEQAARWAGMGPFEQAGAALDPGWADNLRRCGLEESGADRFGLGASARMVSLLSKGRGLEGWRGARRDQLAKATLDSLADLALDERPLRGMEAEAVEALAQGDFEARERFGEKLALAMEARALAPVKSGPRL